ELAGDGGAVVEMLPRGVDLIARRHEMAMHVDARGLDRRLRQRRRGRRERACGDGSEARENVAPRHTATAADPAYERFLFAVAQHHFPPVAPRPPSQGGSMPFCLSSAVMSADVSLCRSAVAAGEDADFRVSAAA